MLLGRLDLKLFAGAETDNTKAATRLASDMGEFFMPFAGTRVNQATAPLDAAGMPGAASYYEVKFTDTTKPAGQIWAGVVGSTPPPGTPRGQRAPERWFVVWLGTANQPGGQGCGDHVGAVDPAVHATSTAATASAAGPERPAGPERTAAGSQRAQASSRRRRPGARDRRTAGDDAPVLISASAVMSDRARFGCRIVTSCGYTEG